MWYIKKSYYLLESIRVKAFHQAFILILCNSYNNGPFYRRENKIEPQELH